MNEKLNMALTWIKSNKWLSIGIGAAAVLLFFPKLLRSARRRKRRVSYGPARTVRRRKISLTKRGTPRKQYTKGGKAKKAWQIKGSLAARRHMARIRKMRA